MYILTSKGLGQVRLPHVQYGIYNLPKKVQDFLEQVRNNPRSFELLLLEAYFHPDPPNNISKPWQKITELVLFNKAGADANVLHRVVAGILKEMSKQHQAQDPQFARQVNDERKFLYQLSNATRALVPAILKPHLLDAWLADDSTLTMVGSTFAAQTLPQTLRPKIIQSQIPQAHFFFLGQDLRQLAEELQKKDPDFKRHVVDKLMAVLLSDTNEVLAKSKSTTLKSFLLNAARSSKSNQEQIGSTFARRWLRSSLYKRAINSGSAAGIFIFLGEHLQEHAKSLRRRRRL